MLLALCLRQKGKDPDSQTYSTSVHATRSVKPDLGILSVKGTGMPKDVTMFMVT